MGKARILKTNKNSKYYGAPKSERKTKRKEIAGQGKSKKRQNDISNKDKNMAEKKEEMMTEIGTRAKQKQDGREN